MKKIISSILLAVSATSSFLLAQNEYDQVASCRLQALSREQETGYRVKDRLEEEKNQTVNINQDTNYSLQTEANEKIELGSEDYIRQGVETTTNDELPTANCDNALRCHLTMNYGQIDSVQGILELLDENPLRTSRTFPKRLMVNEVQGVHGAQNVSIQELLEDISLSSPIAATVSPTLDLQPPTTILPVGQLGAHILSLPPEMIFQFLRSPEPKQTAYKAEHEQRLQELQAEYSCLTYPELAQKIVDWKRAVEGWSECRIPESKDARYQNVVALASDMPPELYRLVALSQAMKIMEDAKVYTYYLPRAWKKYDKDAETEEARIEAKRSKIILLAQIDTINNNILNLENAADAILSLAEQRTRCLVAATAAVRAEEKAKIIEGFQNAARTAGQAITSYCQFSEKMKEGDPTIASLFRIEGFSLECNALKQEYSAQAAITTNRDNTQQSEYVRFIVLMTTRKTQALSQAAQARSEGKYKIARAYEQAAQYNFQAARAIASRNTKEAENFAKAGDNVYDGVKLLGKAAQVRSEGQDKVVKAYEQAAQYFFQAARAVANGGFTKESNFITAAYKVSDIVKSLEDAAQARREGQDKIAKVYEQVYQYRVQQVQAVANGDYTKESNFSQAVCQANHAVRSLKHEAKATSEGQLKMAEVHRQAVQYYFQSVQAAANGDRTKGENFSKAAEKILNAANPLQDAALARSEDQVEAAKAFEQAAQYYFEEAQATANGNNIEAENFSKAARSATYEADNLKKAAQARSEDQVEVAKAFEQAAQYRFEAAQAAVEGDTTKVEGFSNAAKKVVCAAKPLQDAVLARSEDQVEAAKAFEQAAQYYFEAAQAAANGNNIKAGDFSKAASLVNYAARSLKDKAKAISERQVKTAEIYEQTALYSFFAAHAVANGDKEQSKIFEDVAYKVFNVAQLLKRAWREGNLEAEDILEKAAQYFIKTYQTRSEGNIEISEAFTQAAQYALQAAKTAANGDNKNKFLNASSHAANAAEHFKEAAQARSEGNLEISEAFTKAAQYVLQAAKAAANGDKIQTDYFLNESLHAVNAVKYLQQAAQELVPKVVSP